MNEKKIENIKIFIYRFKDYLVSERKLSKNTVSSYYKDLSQFLDFIKEDTEINDIAKATDIESLDKYLIWLYSKGMTSRSIVRKLSSITLFLKFLKIENVIEDNPSSLLNRPRIDKKLPKYLTLDEIESILNTFDISKPDGIRDRTLFELIYSCGLRVSEVSLLNVGSVYFKESILLVFGKGSKERYVPIGERAIKELKNYMTSARPLLVKKRKKSEALFLNYRGDRISRKGIWKNLKKALFSTDIEHKDISVHTLRHSFATHLIQNGADIRSVQALLGHKNIVTTEIYTHLNTEHLRKVYEKYHVHS